MFIRAFALALALVALPHPAVATDGPPIVATVTISFVDVDPCTGELQKVTFLITRRDHRFALEDPARHHLNRHVTVEITTSSGYEGRGVRQIIDNGAGPFGGGEGRGMFTLVINDQLRAPDGRFMRVHLTFHITVVGGEVVSEVDNLAFECVRAAS